MSSVTFSMNWETAVAERNIEAIYPLAAIQEGVLYHVLEASRPGVYVVQYSCRYRGELDADTLHCAWQDTVAAHPALRTLLTWKGREKPLQVVRAKAELPWRYEDWRDFTDQDTRWRELMARDRATGFILDQAPLARVHLMRLEQKEHALLFTFHHSVIDGWSMHLVLNEVALRYDKQPIPTNAPPFQKYVRWLDQQDAAAAHVYWSEHLSGFDEPLKPFFLKKNLISPDVESSYARLGIEMDSKALLTFARGERVTLNTLIVAAWSQVLAAASRSSDVVFGTTVSGRPAELPGIDQTVGLFINTVPLRVHTNHAETVGDWLRAIQTTQTQSRRHEQTPLANIARSSELSANIPLFETIVVFENMPSRAPTGTLAPIAIEHVDYSNYPFALIGVPGETLELIAIYDPRRVSETDAADLLERTRHALRSLTSAATVHEVSILDTVELQASPAEPVTTEYEAVHRRFAQIAARNPETLALIDQKTRLTYTELSDHVSRLAGALEKRGVGAGTALPIFLDRCAEHVISMLAVLSTGAAYVPLDPLHPRERINTTLDDLLASGSGLSVPFVLSGDARRADLDGIGIEVLTIVELDEVDAPFLKLAETTSDQLAYVIYTSGSTGQAKGVMVSHDNLAASTAARFDFYDTPPARFLLLSSLATDSAAAGVFWTLTSGGTLYLPEQRAEQNMASLIAWMDAEQITHTLCVPSLYRVILEQAPKDSLGTLETVIVAAEASDHALIEAHNSRLPQIPLVNEYGPSEATVWATAGRLDTLGPGEPIVIGSPIAGCSVTVMSPTGVQQPDGWPGELCISGPGVALGYLGRPDETAARFVDTGDTGKRYMTGDLGRRLPNGEIEWFGRVDNQFKVRGYRVEPEDIEKALTNHPAVREAAVVLHSETPEAAMLATALSRREDGETLLREIEALASRRGDALA
jgi:microcystin synthetase protein McyB